MSWQKFQFRGVKIEDARRGRKFGRNNVISACCRGKIIAPRCYKHNTNAVFFEDWFEHDLLSVVPCGHTIIMDNASFHRKKKLREIAKRYSVNLLFLPPYSPDLNPIEKFWANMKTWLRKNITYFASLHLAIRAYFVRFLY